MLHHLRVVSLIQILVLMPQMDSVSAPKLKVDQKLLLMTARMLPMVLQMDLAFAPKLQADRKLLLTIAQMPQAGMMLQKSMLRLADLVVREYSSPQYAGKHLVVTPHWKPDSPCKYLFDWDAHSRL
jgi:hypothetical protein